MSEVFKLGDLVWAKMKGFSPWPGRVSNPSKDLKKPAHAKRRFQCIFFFGTNNYAWIEESNIKPYHKFKDTLIKSNKSGAFKDAVEAIEEFIAKGEVFDDGLDPDSLFDRLKEETMSEKKTTTKTPKPHKETPKTKRLDSDMGDPGPPLKKERRESSTSNSHRVGSISPALNHSTPPRKSGSTLLNRPANIARPVTPPLDVETLSQTLKEKNILPSNLKFGFLGLGIMGSGIVKNLINSGHSVIVWNRTQEKRQNVLHPQRYRVLIKTFDRIDRSNAGYTARYRFESRRSRIGKTLESPFSSVPPTNSAMYLVVAVHYDPESARMGNSKPVMLSNPA
ncbi:hypothetical protein KM043_005806 [Ampulex compressa]|nr:hypothetical protein KM043_005806 [Ampulex compressa]